MFRRQARRAGVDGRVPTVPGQTGDVRVGSQGLTRSRGPSRIDGATRSMTNLVSEMVLKLIAWRATPRVGPETRAWTISRRDKPPSWG